MIKPVNPIPVGSLHIRPNWRFDLLQNPAKYKLQDFVAIPASSSGSLKRFLKVGLAYEVHFVIPEYIKAYLNHLSEEEGKKLVELWTKQFNRSGRKRVEVDTNRHLFKANPVWNLKKVPYIQDEFTRRVIYHISNYQYDKDIQIALDLRYSEENQEIFRWIGYGIYAGVSDIKLAARWKQRIKTIEAIRMLFFDFSRFPKDRIASFTYLRQLSNNGLFDELDFAYFRRVFEMGELGLKLQIDPHSLTPQEKTRAIEFLGNTAISNTLNLHFTIKDKKDAHAYGLQVSNLAGYYIKQKEATYIDAKVRNLDAQTRRIDSTMVEPGEDMSSLDREMIKLLREHSLKEAPAPEFKTLADLKK